VSAHGREFCHQILISFRPSELIWKHFEISHAQRRRFDQHIQRISHVSSSLVPFFRALVTPAPRATQGDLTILPLRANVAGRRQLTRRMKQWSRTNCLKGIIVGSVLVVAIVYVLACCVAIRSHTAAADLVPGLMSGTSLRHSNAEVAPTSTAEDTHLSIRAELGHGSWNMLHRLAAKFPATPTQQQRHEIEQFFGLLGQWYPCDECAEHFRAMLADHPVQSGSHVELTSWLCERHNQVNARLGKPQFPCDAASLKEKWGDCGCSEGGKAGEEGAVEDVPPASKGAVVVAAVKQPKR